MELILAIYVPRSTVEDISYNYTALRSFHTDLVLNTTSDNTRALKLLNLQNNDFFWGFIPSIVEHAPNLVELNLLGLDINYPVNLANSTRLLKINYNHLIVNDLVSLTPRQSLDVLDINSWGKKRTRATDLSNLASLVLGCDRIKLELVKCKVLAPNRARLSLEASGAEIWSTANSCIILKCSSCSL